VAILLADFFNLPVAILHADYHLLLVFIKTVIIQAQDTVLASYISSFSEIIGCISGLFNQEMPGFDIRKGQFIHNLTISRIPLHVAVPEAFFDL